jgi:hypothetical protein
MFNQNQILMKAIIKLIVIICVLLVSCTEKKETAATTETDKTNVAVLEGMWQLKSGLWDNEDGTFLRYPEDSITTGSGAYIIYSKNHYMLIADAPKMDYYRGELIAYSLAGDQLTVSTKLSNFEKNKELGAVWTISIDDNILSASQGKNKEVWERVE